MNLILYNGFERCGEEICYGIYVMKNSHIEESTHYFMYGVVQP
jgi:hypothetical protein